MPLSYKDDQYFVIDEMSYDDVRAEPFDVQAKVLKIKQLGDEFTVSIRVEYQSEELVIERSLSEFYKTHKVLVENFDVLLDFKWTSRRWSVPGYATARAVKNTLTSQKMPPGLDPRRLQLFLDRM